MKKPKTHNKTRKPAAKKPAAKAKAVKKTVPTISRRKPVEKPKPLRKTTHKKVTPEVSYLLSEDTVSITFRLSGSKPFRTKSVRRGTLEFDRALEAIRAGDMKALVDAMAATEQTVQANIDRFADKSIELRDSAVFIDGEPVPVDLSKRIVGYAEQRLPYRSLVNFWRKLRTNPSYRAVQGLFRFLMKNHFPITEDGHFLAYKGVKADWKDCHTGTISNKIGLTVEMPRNQVDENPNEACSSGLHVASYNYAHTGYGGGHAGSNGEKGHTIVVRVDPADVVAVPYGDADEKMRVCKYVVLAESAGEMKEEAVSESSVAQQSV